MQQTLDLSVVPQERQYEALLDALGALQPAGELVVLTRGSPQVLLRKLVEEQWGTFAWTPLLEEAGRWQSLLRKVPAAPDSLSTFLAADHERCDTLYVNLEALAQAGKGAGPQFRAFETAMRRHFAMEEEGFFPEFDLRMGMRNEGPTAIMREEHAQMRSLLDRMSLSAANDDLEGLLSAGETLLMMIQQHNMKEEQMLYPMADEVFSSDIQDVLKKLILY